MNIRIRRDQSGCWCCMGIKKLLFQFLVDVKKETSTLRESRWKKSHQEPGDICATVRIIITIKREAAKLKGKSEVTKSVFGFVQVRLHALLSLVQTGEMTQSQAKMFTGRCVLKELSLAGHGSGKYPAVRCICNSLLFPIPPTKSWPFKEMMDELATATVSPPFSSFSFFFFPFHWRLKLCLC